MISEVACLQQAEDFDFGFKEDEIIFYLMLPKDFCLHLYQLA